MNTIHTGNTSLENSKPSAPAPSFFDEPPELRKSSQEHKDCVYLWWEDPEHPLTGTYWLRAGVCWPIYSDGVNALPYGCSVLVGQRLSNKQFYVFREDTFSTMANASDGEGNMLPGFEKAAVDYKLLFNCEYFFHMHPDHIHRKYLLQMIRNKDLPARTMFTPVPWGDTPAEAEQVIWERVGADDMHYRSGGLIHKGIIARASPNERPKQPPPEFWALMSALAGMDCNPRRGS